MENRIDELMQWNIDILSCIFSEQTSKKEDELIKSIFLEYFATASNDGNAVTGLIIFSTYLQRLFSLLLDGYAEED